MPLANLYLLREGLPEQISASPGIKNAAGRIIFDTLLDSGLLVPGSVLGEDLVVCCSVPIWSISKYGIIADIGYSWRDGEIGLVSAKAIEKPFLKDVGNDLAVKLDKCLSEHSIDPHLYDPIGVWFKPHDRAVWVEGSNSVSKAKVFLSIIASVEHISAFDMPRL